MSDISGHETKFMGLVQHGLKGLSSVPVFKSSLFLVMKMCELAVKFNLFKWVFPLGDNELYKALSF